MEVKLHRKYSKILRNYKITSVNCNGPTMNPYTILRDCVGGSFVEIVVNTVYYSVSLPENSLAVA